jgi:phosphoribosylformylglycinamidine synthase
VHGVVGGKLDIDLQLEVRVQRAALAAIRQGLATAAHDCSDGGLAIALAEMCLAGGHGLDAAAAALGGRLDAALFGEAQSRIVIAIAQGRGQDLSAIASGLNVPIAFIGRVTADPAFRLGPVELDPSGMRDAYEHALPELLGAGSATA